MSKLSFKKGPKPTGLASIARPYADIDVKMDGKKCGYIRGPSAQSIGGQPDWSITIMIKRESTEKNPAPFSNRSFKARFKSEKEAREFLKGSWDQIIERYDLYAD